MVFRSALESFVLRIKSERIRRFLPIGLVVLVAVVAAGSALMRPGRAGISSKRTQPNSVRASTDGNDPNSFESINFTDFPKLREQAERLSNSDPLARVDFNRQVRPILADFCYPCHGPAEQGRRADLRLDRREEALRPSSSGKLVIHPFDPPGSELLIRIQSSDMGCMPPKRFGKELSAVQIDILRRWIEEGATYTEHWAYTPLVSPAVPQPSRSGWVRNAIDAFILARLEPLGLTPSAEAERPTLIRRLSLGLTGLPPSPREVDEFTCDPSADAYERLVDRLLASPHYGEQMAVSWLDLARYADTNGGNVDNGREMWPYRDWTIAAFNDNMPFDQFTIEQLAGDLLPNATLTQKVATGFLRNEALQLEVCPEQIINFKLCDRVNTVSTVWLGLTAACAQCHDHKYDPLTQKDYYRLQAFFNNQPKDGSPRDQDPRGNQMPVLAMPSQSQLARVAEIESRMAQVEAKIKELAATTTLPTQPATRKEAIWIDGSIPRDARNAMGSLEWEFARGPNQSLRDQLTLRLSAEDFSFRAFDGATEPLAVYRGDILFADVYLDPENSPAEILVQFTNNTPEHRAYWGEDRIKWGQDGHPSRKRMGELPAVGRWVRLEIPADVVGLNPQTGLTGMALAVAGGTAHWGPVGVIRSGQNESFTAWEEFERTRENDRLPTEVRTALRTKPDLRNEKQRDDLRRYYVQFVYAPTQAAFSRLRAERDRLRKERTDIKAATISVMVMEEPRERADTHVLIRGDFAKKGEKVSPGVPRFLPPLPAGANPDRLGFARWLMSPNHPLTARVAVNRIWQMHFGVGLVATPEDFGSQGEPPTHPALLDWLAVRFIESGWDVKALNKLIVCSAAYRQSSRVTSEGLRLDARNRLLARGPRFRLPAETIRDNALAIGGLLNLRMGGPSVRPYQPPGLWEAVRHPGREFTAQEYIQSHGEDLYRRGVYVFSKRTMPHPALSLFDAPNRDVCTVRRSRTNTALQALALLNDPTIVESARGIAVRMVLEGGREVDDQLAYGFRLCTARSPRPTEIATLRRLFDAEADRFQANPAAAIALVGVGESTGGRDMDQLHIASLTVVANLLLNLDETMTQE